MLRGHDEIGRVCKRHTASRSGGGVVRPSRRLHEAAAAIAKAIALLVVAQLFRLRGISQAVDAFCNQGWIVGQLARFLFGDLC